MNVYLDMVGCRLNQAEIERYARQFRAAGHVLVGRPEEANLVVVNTCAVTAAAAADSRQKLRQLSHSGAEVVATGCWSTLHPQETAAFPNMLRIIPNYAKDRLVSDLLALPEDGFDLEPVERVPIPGARLRTRAFIKVQDGCDNRCTFCVTTLARGSGRSRSIHDVLLDVQAALGEATGGVAGNRAREIVLTGVHLGAWGHDLSPDLHLRNLISAILEYTDAPRLRLSSLEPWDLDEDFFQLWQNPRMCRHLHLPLQSGSASTLRRMGRKTAPVAFASLAAAARCTISGVAITTDIIAGFPGESEAEFQESLAFVRSTGFAGGHVFTYSARPGTAAARMSGQVPYTARKERNARLRAALAEAERAFQTSFVDQVLPVLWESTAALGPDGWRMSGLTDNYLRVNALAPRDLWNDITPVRLTGVGEHGLHGQIQAYEA